jgi:hypothetical protein
MGQIISNLQFWDLSNEEIIRLTKGKTVRIVFNNGEEKRAKIKNILGASFYPHEFSGFITTDNHTIYSEKIDFVELIDTGL